MSATKHLNIIVQGRVHGVLYRDSAKWAATELGVVGFAENRSDGTVYIEAEGTDAALRRFLEWCHRGPEHALVEKVTATDGEIKDFAGFAVK